MQEHDGTTSPAISRREYDLAFISPEVRLLMENQDSYLKYFLTSNILPKTAENIEQCMAQPFGGLESAGFVVLVNDHKYVIKFTPEIERSELEGKKLKMWEDYHVNVPHVLGFGEIKPPELAPVGYIIMDPITLEEKFAPRVMDILKIDGEVATQLGVVSGIQLAKMHSAPITENVFAIETANSIMESKYAIAICEKLGIPYEELNNKIKEATSGSIVSLIHGDFSPRGNILVSGVEPYSISVIDPHSPIGDPYSDLVYLSWFIASEQFVARKLHIDNHEVIQALRDFTVAAYRGYELETGRKIDVKRFTANAIAMVIKKCNNHFVAGLNEKQYPPYLAGIQDEILDIYIEKLNEMVPQLLGDRAREEYSLIDLFNLE